MHTPAAHTTTSLASAAIAQRQALWRYVRVLGADAATADDIVQDAFVVALRRPNFDATSPAGTFVFLRETARHLWLKSRRRRVSVREVEEADQVWQSQCDDLGEDYTAALRTCVDALPPRSRALLETTYTQSAGRAAAGREFGLSKDGVKSALRRLRAHLHDCIARRLGAKP